MTGFRSVIAWRTSALSPGPYRISLSGEGARMSWPVAEQQIGGGWKSRSSLSSQNGPFKDGQLASGLPARNGFLAQVARALSGRPSRVPRYKFEEAHG